MGPAGKPPIALQRRPIAGKGDGYVVGADVAEAEPLLRCRPALTVLYTDRPLAANGVWGSRGLPQMLFIGRAPPSFGSAGVCLRQLDCT